MRGRRPVPLLPVNRAMRFNPGRRCWGWIEELNAGGVSGPKSTNVPVVLELFVALGLSAELPLRAGMEVSGAPCAPGAPREVTVCANSNRKEPELPRPWKSPLQSSTGELSASSGSLEDSFLLFLKSSSRTSSSHLLPLLPLKINVGVTMSVRKPSYPGLTPGLGMPGGGAQGHMAPREAFCSLPPPSHSS